MPRRTAIHATAIAVIFCAVGQEPASTDQSHPYQKAAQVCLDAKVRDEVSGPAFNTLRDEASRIWLKHGVELKWTRPAEGVCDSVIPLVFDDHEVVQRRRSNERNQTLARTVFSGQTRTVYISARRAFEMVTALFPEIVSDSWRQIRMAKLLGRIIAHELGHVLLANTAHAASGLMRPVYGLSDVLSDDERMTALSLVETQRLAARFSLVPAERPKAFAAIQPILWP